MKLRVLLEAPVYDGSYQVIIRTGSLTVGTIQSKRKLDKFNRLIEDSFPSIKIKEYKSMGGGMFKIQSADYFKLIDFLEKSKFHSIISKVPDVVEYSVRDLNLTSLDNIPSEINGSLDCSNNLIETLEGIHKKIKSIDGSIDLNGNPIKSHVLGLFRIRGLNRVLLDNTKVETIINKYLPEGRAGLPKAQNELIEAGLEEYAQL